MNEQPLPAAPPTRPKRRAWRWFILVIVIVLILAGLGMVSLIAMVAGTSQKISGSASGETGRTTMALSLAPTAAPSYDVAMEESAGQSAISAKDNSSYPAPQPSYDTAGQTAAEVDQKIIKNGSLQLTVKDVTETAAKITALAVAKNGFVQNSSASEREDGTHYGQIAIRVPAKDFETAMSEIKTYAVAVKNETATGQDVTEQYTDLAAQLHNAQAQEKTYLAVLDKAKTVEDILKVQSYLSQVRGTIESLQGRLKYLENVTAYSTVSVYLEEEPIVRLPTKEFRPITEIKAAVQALISAGQKLVVSLIWAIVLGGGLLLPLVILGFVAVWLIRKNRRQTK